MLFDCIAVFGLTLDTPMLECRPNNRAIYAVRVRDQFEQGLMLSEDAQMLTAWPPEDE